MKGFKDSTRMKSGHAFTHPSGWFPNSSSPKLPGFATGGTVGGLDTHEDPSKARGNATVQRDIPTTDEMKEAGGHNPLRSGFSQGGVVHKHFHVHHHSGGKTKSKSYEKTAEAYAEGGKAKIRIKAKNEGSLHRDMGVPQGKKIPRSAIRAKLARDKAHHNVRGERKDIFALNFGKKKGHNAGGAVYASGGSVNGFANGGALGASLGNATGRAVRRPQPDVSRGLRQPRRAIRPPSQMPSPTRQGIEAIPLARRKGGSVNPDAAADAKQARRIADQEIRKHVGSPAPEGHKGLGKMLRRR